MKTVEREKALLYLGLSRNWKKGLTWAGLASLALILYFVVVHLGVLNKSITFNLTLHDWLNTILLVGIIEEIVFRGFLLRKLRESFRFWNANVVTSLLFVSIHFPIWIYKDLFVFPYILTAITTSFVLSMLFGYIYKRSNSLWSVIIIHSLYNLLVSVFY
ncbi:CPBP family intramembrane glutamic endopeptidase [Oceanobacillus manasiensis]|uniref:CPBP family intramembrane glutamic endopeptidase n=1 Tax=Oceanobacillus manasiensis TaxID=586413 RepID=UPI000A4FB6A8|nr:CPBP family intramembrane glutamic endopeptidase [Oceanobacillus manasiensis]